METRPAPCDLWTAEEAAAADGYTMGPCGIPSSVLMERAALCVARVAADRARAAGLSVVALAGPGNNGGDAVACARILHGWNIEATVVLSTDADRGTLAEQVAWARAAGVPVLDARAPLPEGPAVWVDGLLGTGSRGAPRGPVARRVAELRARAGPVVAVDVPSGVDPTTGAVADPHVSADVTVTFGRSKPGLHVTPGREPAGRVLVASMGLVSDPSTGGAHRLVDPRAVAAWVGGLPAGPHKGARGRLVVVGGGRGTPGAAVLAGAAALRAGVGIVEVATPDAGVRAQLVAHRPELVAASTLEPAAFDRTTAAVVGPGLTDPEGVAVAAVWWSEAPVPAVFDASALAHLPAVCGPAPRIVTPHPKEAARMLAAAQAGPAEVAWVQAHRIETARRLCEATGAIVVLKGAGTVVAHPDGPVAVATEGGPALSTGGTGDVLAGLVGALLARGLDPWRAACAGVHLHAIAGSRARRDVDAGNVGVVAMDVAAAIPAALADPTRAERYPALLEG